LDEEVFLVSEVWLNPGCADDFKRYLIRVRELLDRHGAECVYHGHPFDWAPSAVDGDLPTGIEVLRFQSEGKARAALDLLADTELVAERTRTLLRARTYLSKYSAGQGPADSEGR
jgi:hypothetical protein